MSGEASGWVYRYSPYNESAFQCHCAIGDAANDMHDHEIWFSVAKLAAKARCSSSSARRALHRMVVDGFLEELEVRNGDTTRYRMLFPDVPMRFDPSAPRGIPDDDPSHGGRGGLSPRAGDPSHGGRGTPLTVRANTKKEPKKNRRRTRAASLESIDACPPPWISSDMTYAEWIALGKTDNPKEQTA